MAHQGDNSFELKVVGADLERLANDPGYLRSLCQNEVERFVQYLRSVDPQFRDGLARFERLAIEGYLYQKAKGHLDAQTTYNPYGEERSDGTTPG